MKKFKMRYPLPEDLEEIDLEFSKFLKKLRKERY